MMYFTDIWLGSSVPSKSLTLVTTIVRYGIFVFSKWHCFCCAVFASAPFQPDVPHSILMAIGVHSNSKITADAHAYLTKITSCCTYSVRTGTGILYVCTIIIVLHSTVGTVRSTSLSYGSFRTSTVLVATGAWTGPYGIATVL